MCRYHIFGDFDLSLVLEINILVFFGSQKRLYFTRCKLILQMMCACKLCSLKRGGLS